MKSVARALVVIWNPLAVYYVCGWLGMHIGGQIAVACASLYLTYYITSKSHGW